MENILHVHDCGRILTRIDALNDTDPAQWGTMTASQMICHLADQIRVALGSIAVADQSTFLTRTVTKRLVLLGMPIPRGKVQTFPEIDQAAGKGTAPTTFADDVAALKHVISEFIATEPNFAFQRHSLFGALNRQQWGRLISLHLDYHLRQFGR